MSKLSTLRQMYSNFFGFVVTVLLQSVYFVMANLQKLVIILFCYLGIYAIRVNVPVTSSLLSYSDSLTHLLITHTTPTVDNCPSN